MTTKGSQFRLAGVLSVTVALCSCSTGSGVRTQGPAPTTAASTSSSDARTPSPTSPAVPTPTFVSEPPGAESAMVLSQYRAFFAAITPIWTMPDAAARASSMAKVAVDPEYTTLLSAMKATRDGGEVSYGDDVVRPVLQSVAGDQATVEDCQDTSSHGRMKIDTGVKVTQGRKNDLAQVTMKRGQDGIWRVATVAYAAAGSCHADG